MLNKRSQAGVTLIEMTIALLISGFIMAGVLGLLLSMMKHSRETLAIGRLNHDLHLVLNSVQNDIRRAGYWASASSSSVNPFQVVGSTDITINASGNCILMTYDHDNDGALPSLGSGADDERYGYRLMNGAIQYRPNGAAFSCSAAANSWADLTDPLTITVTQFSLSETAESIDIDGEESGTSTITVRYITVQIAAQLTNDSAVSSSLTERVKVYNDRYNP